MAIPDLDPTTGLLPRGRFPVTEAEISTRFVSDPRFQASQTRPQIWADFQAARSALFALVPVLGAWIAGSFTTAKVDPGDIDVLWIVDDRPDLVLDESSRTMLTLFGQGKNLGQRTGWRVDSYVLAWVPIVIWNQNDRIQTIYHAMRGYWDDWFLRQQQGPKNLPATLADTVPRRGYLEVTYRDYLRP